MSKYISQWTRDRLRKTASYPLRRVVEIECRDTTRHGMMPYAETLECGHRMLVREDFIGPTSAARRRCKQCAESAQKGEG